MQDYKEEKMMEKINEDEERGNKMRADKDELLEQRQKLRTKVQQQKQKIMATYAMMKKNKSRSTISNESSIMSTSMQNKSITFRNTTSKSARSADISLRNTANESPTATDKRSKSPGNTTFLTDMTIKEKPPKKSLKRKNKEKLEEFKRKQDEEIIGILEEEQKLEKEREEKLEACPDEEARKEMEEQFGIERAKASKRIVKKSKENEKVYKKYARRLKSARMTPDLVN